MFDKELIKRFEAFATPFYYYDIDLLRKTLTKLKEAVDRYGYNMHYAVKANANPRILKEISSFGFGADCVSGNEVVRALECGFPADKIVFAGVGKSDAEITVALKNDIFCFNAESLQELEVINKIAGQEGKIASVALRLNPGIDAHTNKCINTGLADSKFGIDFNKLEATVAAAQKLGNIKLVGLHFHIGSQITDKEPYRLLCQRSNEMQEKLSYMGLDLPEINLGGGLGVDYENPDSQLIPDFASLMETIHANLNVKDRQRVHFEFGRAVVAQCGTMVSKVLYIKPATQTTFAIVDAGFTDLIRPALYGAHHKIENLSSHYAQKDKYDIVGPICESTDVFDTGITLPKTVRGDLIAFRTAGAYGEIMASRYNLRNLPNVYYSDN
ncbi:MAG: diaminopimelate decarboxylase [Bacteroidales bacterium]|nr:diaminopimelate decarboxylase [Bacteroidales bacterium]MBQ2098677.1 diaminopimelate decarboxylase [Bacteroidales bacterium]